MKPIAVRILYIILLFFTLFQLYRLTFYVFNSGLFSNITFLEAVNIIKGGFLFDLVLTTILLVPLVALIIVMIVSKRKKAIRLAIIMYTITIISALTLLALTDMIYYHYNLHHISKADLQLIYENKGMAGVYTTHYWYWLILFVLVLYGAYAITVHCITAIDKQPVNNRKKLILVLSMYFLLFVSACIAGKEKLGFGFLTPASAFRFSSPEFTAITLNASYFLIHSLIKGGEYEEILRHDYADKKDACKKYPTRQILSASTPYNGYLKGKNLFIFIIESASRELFIDSFPVRPVMPFLDSLKKRSLFFTNAFANGGSSPEGVNAILGGVPGLFSRPFNRTEYAYHPHEFMGNKLQAMGYYNNFYYSTDRYAAGFSKVAQLYGINNYLSVSDFGLTEAPTWWGQYDHIFFPAVARKMEHISTPFFSVLFNINTHGPFTILPDSLLEAQKKKKLDLAQAFEYYDNVVRNFFAIISHYSWYKNTAFIFVADHYSRSADLQDQSRVGHYRIPMMIYTPGEVLKGEYAQPVQQIDLPVTLLNLVGYQGTVNSLGRNILDTTHNRHPFVVNRLGESIQIINDSLALAYSIETNAAIGCWNYKKDSELKEDVSKKYQQEKEQLLQDLKYYLQSFKELYNPASTGFPAPE